MRILILIKKSKIFNKYSNNVAKYKKLRKLVNEGIYFDIFKKIFIKILIKNHKIKLS